MFAASKFKFVAVVALFLVGAPPHQGAHAEGALLLAEIFASVSATPRQSQMLFPLQAAVSAFAAENGKPSIPRLNNAAAPSKAIELADGDAGGADEATEQGSGSAPIGEAVERLPAADAGSRFGAVDPDFEKWQRHADEKLKGERAPKSIEHPLMKDYPLELIIVCEAGCRGGRPDEIVSRIAKPEHLNSAARSFAPTSSDPKNMEATSPEAPPGLEQDPSAINCEAGCYGRTKTHKARLPRRAATDRFGASQQRGHRLLIGPQTAVNGAIVGPYFAPRHSDLIPSAAPLFKPSLSETPVARVKRAAGFARRVASRSRLRLVENLN